MNFEQWMDQQRPWWRHWKDESEATARLMREAWDAAMSQKNDKLEGLRSFKRSVDAALNSGDGSYRP